MIKTGTKWDGILEQLDEYRYVIPKSYKKGMSVDALIFSSPKLLPQLAGDLSLEQAANVAMLPGILNHALAMPDMHQGYGFPIGGVAAMDMSEGVVSPGGVGFDINCGVRLLSSNLTREETRPRLEDLVQALFKAVPAGTGHDGRINLSNKQLDAVLTKGLQWAIENGYGRERDRDHAEESGVMPNADPSQISERAKKRGSTQLGTLGSGNHFLEVQYVHQIFDEEAAKAFGLSEGQICVMIHCGSRGLGHQVCTDFLATIKPQMEKYGISVPDRELACLPINSPEGQSYLAAMAAAANFAFANRECISHWTQEAFASVFGKKTKVDLMYDVTHNMAKQEMHKVNGEERKVLVHRKGATRAFPKGRPELTSAFKDIGQPVIIPGDMGRASYVLVGTERALDESFGSVCHGAGRLMSRTQARKGREAKDVVLDLAKKGIIAKATTREGLTEEVPDAYKSIEDVIDVVHSAGLARRVARMKPIAVIKG
ncbi:MAG TPA: RtcB family protein [Candidatus Obscuribacterales bacterium]